MLTTSFVSSQSDFSEFQIFKEDVVQQVYDDDAYIPLMDMDEAKEDLVQLTRSYDELVDSVTVLNQRQKGISKHYNNAKLSATLTIQDMTKTQDILSKRRSQVALSLNRVKKLQLSLAVLWKDITEAKKQISTYSRFLFKTGNDYYLTADELSDIKVLTKSESIAHTIWKEELSRLLYTWLEYSFEKMNELTSSYEGMLHDLQQHIASYHEEIDLYQDDLDHLEQQRAHVEQILQFLEEDKSYLDDQLNRFNQSKVNLQHQIDRMDKITQETATFLWKNKEVDALLKEEDRSMGWDYFSWPVRVPSWINSEVTKAQYEQASWIALHATQWEELYAPAPGIVYKVYSDTDVSLHRMILLHKYGYSTVILPMSQVFVQPWDVVKRGQIIGRAWWKPWTIWAWIESTWSHVYFEVMKNSESIDPFLVMDLSVYQQIDMLDEQYHLKRKQDYLSRRVDLSDLPNLKGDTPEQRRDYFLSKSWNSIFSDPWLRLSAAEWAWIDPIFGICIGAAETSYRNFKSWNNIGNVWNDDSWNTIVYDSPKAWVAAIYKTLSNKYLGHYTMMSQLSRFGNKTWSIYASDPVNRQKNILRCLSMIYEVNVPEDYFFRVVD